MWKDKLQNVVNYIIKHSKVVFPVLIIAAVAVTVSVALNAGGENRLEEEPETTVEESTEDADEQQSTVGVPMTLNEDPAITALFTTFYNAIAVGDTETMSSLCDEIPIQDLFSYQERSKYIDHYPALEIYTRPGPEADSLIVFIYYRVVFVDYEAEYPGYSAHYVCTNDDGEYYIKKGEVSDETNQYIKKVLEQDDVKEFNNRVTVEYNELMMTNPELLAYLKEMDEQVEAAVGVDLAQANAGEAQGEDGAGENGEGQSNEEPGGGEEAPVEAPAENTVQYASATTTVNVRNSDSEQADRLGQVTGGTQLQVLEQKVNGWTKVVFEGKEGYIKSEYLEMVESAEGAQSIGTVTATTNINVRSSASETAEKLGVLAGGDTAELLANENGWCKIKYNGKVGYVKSDYVQ